MVRAIEVEESNPRLKAAFLEVVENQLRDNEPPQTRETLNRLMADGVSKDDAKIYIAQAVCVEVWDTLRNQKAFDLQRYVRNLKNLPKEPEDK
jgi:hypothetical protein